MSAIKVCRERGCSTNLSRFNPGFLCWTHTPDLTETMWPEEHVRFHMNVMTRGVMSDEFLEGVPGAYDFTAEDRRNWARGG